MIDHPLRARVAEILVTRSGRDQTRGSGYLVASGWVLTACHVVDDAASIAVWLGAPSMLAPEAGAGVAIGRVLMTPAADLALLPVDRQVDDPLGEPALFGRLDRDSPPPVPVAAAGCPRFKLRPDPARPDVLLRELHYAGGTIASLSDAKTQTYAFALGRGIPGPDPGPGKHSPWEGMSGAAVWADGRLIGVVGQHYPDEGLGALTVRPVEELFRHASEAQLSAWRVALRQLPTTAEGLWLATPPTVRKIEVTRARRAAEALAPQVLIGRSAELAALEDFADSDKRWRWIQGDAFAGKSALLAWFAVHPPGSVDVVACFLRRTIGENAADYALDVLTRQLALLADRRGYRPPQFLSERANDFADLLDEAARACAERGRRLLVLIDGLDEYDPTTTGFDLAAWLPDASTLPDHAMLLVASRAGADVHLPGAHPLFGHAQPITASDAATEIRRAARKELERALRTPARFVFPLVGFLAVADGGLTASELRVLLKRRGRDADVSEIEALLGSSLGRSLIWLPDLDNAGAQMHAFAHNTLLTEARVLVAADLATYEDLYDQWAGDYIERDWPIDTPRYLLRPYTRELARRARDPATPSSRCRAAIDQLFMVVAHHSRSLRLFERTGNPAVPDQEIVAAQHTIVDTRDRSGLDYDEVIFRLAVLALRRRPLTAVRAGIATGIAAVWARIGRVNAAVDLAAGIDAPELRAAALSGVAAALAGAGQAGQAADAARQAVQAAAGIDMRRSVVLSGVAATLAGAGQAGQALQTAASLDDPDQRALTLSGVAAALAGAGQAGQALQAVAALDDPEQRAEALSGVALALLEADLNDPGRLAQVPNGVTLAPPGAGQALQAADAAGQVLQAAAALDDPSQRTLALSGAAAVLAGTGQAADAAEQALQAAADIRDPGQRAEALSWVALVLAGTGQAADAAEQALQAAADVEDPGRRAEVLSVVAVALAGAGQAGQALQTAAALDDSRQRAEALSRVAAVLAGAGQAGQAADAAEQALQTAATPGDPGRAEMLCQVAAVLAGAGLAGQAADAAGQALQAAAALDDPGHREELLSRVAVALAGAGQAGQALQTAAALDDPWQQALTLSGVAMALAEAGLAGQAADAAEQALQTAAALDFPWWRAEVLSGVAVALAGAGQAGQALQTAAALDDPWQQAEALSRVAAVLAGAGQAGQAADAAGQALQAAAGIGDPGHRAEVLSRAAAALAGAGLAGQAADAAGQALQAAAALDFPWQRALVLSGVAVALAGAGQAGQALQTAAALDDPWQQAEALSRVAVALAGGGQAGQAADAAGQALQAAAGVGDPGHRAEVLSRAAAALAGTGQPEQAADAAGQALQAAAALDDPGQRALTLSGVAMALAGAGQAADAAGQALQAAAGVEDPERRAEALSRAAAALAGTGQVEQAADAAGQALRAAAASGNPMQRARVLNEVAAALAGAGQAEQALQAAADIKDPWWRAEALAELLANPVICDCSDGEVGRRALELLLFTSDAAEYLAAFPAALLSHLVANGEFVAAGRQLQLLPSSPLWSMWLGERDVRMLRML